MEKMSRQLVKIVKEICREYDISCQSFSYDWILQLSANKRIMYIYGYRFPNNNASVDQICNDKAALSDILTSHNIPHIPHHFFMSPNNRQYTDPNGNWDVMKSLLRQYGTVVCKPNSGSGGHGVQRVSSNRDLEYCVYSIFSKSRAMSISPYREINAEYRIIVVNSIVGVIYEKRRPSVIGNGTDSIKHLIDLDNTLTLAKVDEDTDLSRIPNENEIVEISWKHNLGQGAHPVIVTDRSKRDTLAKLALSCVKALDAQFLSIDIVEDELGLEIMEINSGVMMENFAKSSQDNYLLAKSIYRKAILSYFRIDDQIKKYTVKRPRKSRFVLPVLEQIATERNVQIISDDEEGNFLIFVFGNGHRFVVKDYPFNINSAGSISLCKNKAACSYFLQKMGFSVPKYKYFVKKSDHGITHSELERSFESPEKLLGFGFPMILKPNSLSQGTGVYKIHNPIDGFLAARNVLSLNEKLLLLQEYCPGRDYRIVVLNHQVIQAYERIPFHIVGNGSDSIGTLLKETIKNFEEYGRDKKVDINDHRILRNISKQGYSLSTILDTGIICILQDIANLSLGGTIEDKTNEITPYYSDLAIRIADSLNLKLCGIDIIANDITDYNNKEYYVLEVNSAPGLDNYAYEGEIQEEYVKNLYGLVFDYLESIEE